jgi:hypothetical protein
MELVSCHSYDTWKINKAQRFFENHKPWAKVSFTLLAYLHCKQMIQKSGTVLHARVPEFHVDTASKPCQ